MALNTYRSRRKTANPIAASCVAPEISLLSVSSEFTPTTIKASARFLVASEKRDVVLRRQMHTADDELIRREPLNRGMA